MGFQKERHLVKRLEKHLGWQKDWLMGLQLVQQKEKHLERQKD